MNSIKSKMIAVLGLFVASATMAAEPAGDPVAGAQVAKDECADCHVVIDDGQRRTDRQPGAAPDFVALAHDPKMTEDHLRQTLRLPHGLMNTVLLVRKDIDDVIAYIFSQKEAE